MRAIQRDFDWKEMRSGVLQHIPKTLRIHNGKDRLLLISFLFVCPLVAPIRLTLSLAFWMFVVTLTLCLCMCPLPSLCPFSFISFPIFSFSFPLFFFLIFSSTAPPSPAP